MQTPDIARLRPVAGRAKQEELCSYAARFVVGAAVPDGGMTVAMLSMALGGLGLLRRKL